MTNDHSDSERGNPLPTLHGILARDLLYAPSHWQDSTYHALWYTSSGQLPWTRNRSTMRDRSNDPADHERTLYQEAISRFENIRNNYNFRRHMDKFKMVFFSINSFLRRREINIIKGLIRHLLTTYCWGAFWFFPFLSFFLLFLSLFYLFIFILFFITNILLSLLERTIFLLCNHSQYTYRGSIYVDVFKGVKKHQDISDVGLQQKKKYFVKGQFRYPSHCSIDLELNIFKQ